MEREKKDVYISLTETGKMIADSFVLSKEEEEMYMKVLFPEKVDPDEAVKNGLKKAREIIRERSEERQSELNPV